VSAPPPAAALCLHGAARPPPALQLPAYRDKCRVSFVDRPGLLAAVCCLLVERTLTLLRHRLCHLTCRLQH
jgi:hypothetical protein